MTEVTRIEVNGPYLMVDYTEAGQARHLRFIKRSGDILAKVAFSHLPDQEPVTPTAGTMPQVVYDEVVAWLDKRGLL